MEYDVVIIPIPCMGNKVLNSFGCSLWEQLDVNIAICGVDDCRVASLGLFGLLFGLSSNVSRFLVLYISA